MPPERAFPPVSADSPCLYRGVVAPGESTGERFTANLGVVLFHMVLFRAWILALVTASCRELLSFSRNGSTGTHHGS